MNTDSSKHSYIKLSMNYMLQLTGSYRFSVGVYCYVLNAIHDFIMLKEWSICVVLLQTQGRGDCNRDARNVRTTAVVNAMDKTDFWVVFLIQTWVNFGWRLNIQVISPQAALAVVCTIISTVKWSLISHIVGWSASCVEHIPLDSKGGLEHGGASSWSLCLVACWWEEIACVHARNCCVISKTLWDFRLLS